MGDGLRPVTSLIGLAPRDGTLDLQPAEAADEPLLRHLFKAARAGQFAEAGLAPAMLDVLLEQQFRAQIAGFAAHFPDAISLIILRRQERIGRLLLAVSDRRWRIVDIVLLPSMQGLGIGTDLIHAVARAAHERGALELALSVLAGNAAARRLYLRLGFVETGGGVYIQMAKRLVR